MNRAATAAVVAAVASAAKVPRVKCVHPVKVDAVAKAAAPKGAWKGEKSKPDQHVVSAQSVVNVPNAPTVIAPPAKAAVTAAPQPAKTTSAKASALKPWAKAAAMPCPVWLTKAAKFAKSAKNGPPVKAAVNVASAGVKAAVNGVNAPSAARLMPPMAARLNLHWAPTRHPRPTQVQSLAAQARTVNGGNAARVTATVGTAVNALAKHDRNKQAIKPPLTCLPSQAT